MAVFLFCIVFQERMIQVANTTYFYALTAYFGRWLKQECRKRKACQWHVATGLMYAQVQKS
jgi:hypothetical protein